jgi:hypothetical protein
MLYEDILDIKLSDKDKEALSDQMGLLLETPFDRNSKTYADAILKSAIPIQAIQDCLFNSSLPFCIVRNLPVDTFGSNGKPTAHDLTSAVLVGITHAIGLDHFGYPEEKDGAILQDVHPIEGWEDTLSNAGRILFNLHVESPFLPRAARPEAAALIAINNDAQSATRIAIVEQINSALAPEVIETLRQPLFTYRHDQSFSVNGYTLISPPSPFLKTIDGFEESRCAIFTNALNAQAEAAVQAWKQKAEETAFNLVLNPGELLIFNNYRCVHGRDAVTGRRWLKRVYGSRVVDLADDAGLVSVWSAVGSTSTDHSF